MGVSPISPAAAGSPLRLVSGRRAWLSAWLASSLVIMAVGLSLGAMPLGIGADTDDTLRFLQLRDLIDGQDWYDVGQSRLGVEGTALHWSRLADLPYLIVAWPLSLFVETNMALRIAGSFVPFLLWGGVVWAVIRAMEALIGRATALPLATVVAALALHAPAFAARFGFGSFDHHHIQLLCLALALAATLASASRRSGALAGLSLAGSALVGLETAPVLVYLCGVWALWWWLAPRERREASIAFGVALAAGVGVGGTLFAADFPMGSALCDAFGIGVGGALLIGGGGVALSALALSDRGVVARLGGLVLVGTVVIAFALLVSPQCLANPMEAMPEDVRALWLGNVQEARPLLDPSIDLPMKAFVAGVPLAALALSVLATWRLEGARRTAALVMAGWLLIAVALTLYQIRFQSLALVPASVVLGAALVMVLDWETETARRLLAVATIAMASVGAVHSGLAVMVEEALDGDAAAAREARSETEDAGEATVAACTSTDTLGKLGALETGLVFAHFNHADEILLHTRHRVLASNYHRGWRDIAAHIGLEGQAAPEAGNALRATGVDYVFACASPSGEPYTILGDGKGFLSGLDAGVPGLDRLDIGLPEGVAVYAVR